MDIDTLGRHISMAHDKIKMTRLLLFDTRGNSDVPMHEAIVLLICDFMAETGGDSFVASLKLCQATLRRYSEELDDALQRHEDGEQVSIPWMFLSVIDNRYIGVQIIRSDDLGTNELWDMSECHLVNNPDAPPIFTLTVSVAAIFIKTVAKHYGYVKAAEAFAKGELICQNSK